MKKIVLPGEVIGATEEYLPGYGTREEYGKIYATIVGTPVADHKNMIISISPVSPLASLKKGDLVYGVVSDVMKDFVIVQVVAKSDFRAIVGGVQSGTVHISKISHNYIQKSDHAFRVGDIIRAKVIKAKPSLQLSTVDSNLGAIKAYCPKCRRPLVKIHNTLICKKCQRKEFRKIASDYGMVEFKY